MAARAARAELERARRLEGLRVRGVRGGVITPHRSMVGLPWTLWRFLSTLLLSLGGLALLVASLPWMGRFWQLGFEWGREFLAIPSPLGDQQWSVPGVVDFTLPVLAVVTPLPGPDHLRIAALAAALVFLLSWLLPARWTPLRYFLRLLALLQGVSVLFFAFSPDPFPYRLQDHVFLVLSSGLVVMGLVPLVLGLTLHVFDLATWQKGLLTLALLAHLAVFIPAQALIHLWLILHGSAVVMPLLFLVFGLLLDVLIFVAFYGWALSWRGTLERRETPPPAHLRVPARKARRA